MTRDTGFSHHEIFLNPGERYTDTRAKLTLWPKLDYSVLIFVFRKSENSFDSVFCVGEVGL